METLFIYSNIAPMLKMKRARIKHKIGCVFKYKIGLELLLKNDGIYGRNHVRDSRRRDLFLFFTCCCPTHLLDITKIDLPGGWIQFLAKEPTLSILTRTKGA
jgi:hypothetical protein